MSAFQEVARTTAIFGLWFIAIPVAIETIRIIINYYKKQKDGTVISKYGVTVAEINEAVNNTKN